VEPARVTVMRWIELSRLTRAASILSLAMIAFASVATSRSNIEQTVTACAVTWALLVAWRSAIARGSPTSDHRAASSDG
jgi:hypothetical protein